MLGMFYEYQKGTDELRRIGTVKDCELEYSTGYEYEPRYAKGYVGFGMTDKFANPVDCEKHGTWYRCVFYNNADVGGEPFFIAKVDAEGITIETMKSVDAST